MKKDRLIKWLTHHCLSLAILLLLMCMTVKNTSAQSSSDPSKPKTSEGQLPARFQTDPIKHQLPTQAIFNFLKIKTVTAGTNTQPVSGITYTFTGKGDWNAASNWQNNLVPPSMLKPGDHVIIDGSGPCLLNDSKPFLVSRESSVQINTGKELYVTIGNNFILKGDLNNNGKLTLVSGTLLTGFAKQSDLKNTGQLKTTALSKIDDKKMLPKEIKKDQL